MPHVQFFPRRPAGLPGAEIQDAGADAPARRRRGGGFHVHAPYIVNVATTNNRIRIPAEAAPAARRCGGRDRRAGLARRPRANKADDPGEGLRQLAGKAVEAVDPLPLLIENTAGGATTMTRYLDRIGRVWDAIPPPSSSTRRFRPTHLPRPRRR